MKIVLISLILLAGNALGSCSKTEPAGSGSGGNLGNGGDKGTGGAIGTGGNTNGTGGAPPQGGSGGPVTGTGGASDAGVLPDSGTASDARIDGMTGGGGAGGTGSPVDAAADAGQAPIEPASGFLCGNWADARDNFVNGNLELSGLSAATDTYATVRAKSDQILAGFQNLGANSVRIPINEPTVLGTWWGAYQGAIDAAVARGMKVILAYWYWDRSTTNGTGGRPTDIAVFNTMWDAVVTNYANNNLVYFQIINEPFGYSPAAFIDLCAQWITRHSQLPKGRIIVGGTFYDSDVRQAGADPRLTGTLLSLHIYPFSNASQTSVQGWRTMLATNLGVYANRTIVTEYGAPMRGGADYSAAGDGNNNTSFIVGMSGYLHDNKMGSCYWPTLRTNDQWSLTTLTGTGTNLSLTVTNATGLARVKAAWNL